MNIQWGQWRLQDGISMLKFMILDIEQQLEQADPDSAQQYRPEFEASVDRKWQELLNNKEIT